MYGAGETLTEQQLIRPGAERRFMGKNNRKKHEVKNTICFCLKKFPEAWKVSVVCFYLFIGEGAAASGHSYIGQQGIVLAPPYPFSNVFGLVLWSSGYRKAILLAYRYSVA